MDISMVIQSQLLATKFFVPAASHPLIYRAYLHKLLHKSLKYPLTIVSAPAGFGKTMLLADWAQSLPANDPLVAWLSLDEEDNEPRLFWTYVLSALDAHPPEPFTSLLKYLQSPQTPPLKDVLITLTNLLVDSTEHYLLILDDYHVIAEEQIHTDLLYLLEHLPAQLHIILATRTDPPLPLPLLRARGQLLEVRTDALRLTANETKSFFHKVIDLQLPDETIQEVTVRTEGWLVALQLLGLSLRDGHANPVNLLDEVSGDQRYILDYLTDEVLGQQPQEVRTFLLSTCILECLNASLCDAVMDQPGSQRMLEHLEQANLFIVSLDNKRQWYRYHALFAEALHYRLEHTQSDLIPILHHRASLWYAQHNQSTQAILHAFRAKDWQLAADLLERIRPTCSWGAGKHELASLRHWLEQLPANIVHARPRLCLTCAHMLWSVTPSQVVQTWLDAAEATLTASLNDNVLTSQARCEQEDLLGHVFACRAFLRSFREDGQGTLELCQRALSLLSSENSFIPAMVYWAQLRTYYVSYPNDAMAAIESGLQGYTLALQANDTYLAMTLIGTTICYMIGTGQLHQAKQLSEQALQLGTLPTGLVLPEVGWPTAFRADILREWNELNAALSSVQEAISLCKQVKSAGASSFLLGGYAILLRVLLSRGDLDAAYSAYEEFERLGRSMNQSWYIYLRSLFTINDQICLWLACGKLEQAIRWAQELNLIKRVSAPFIHEREEVACVRILLATSDPTSALERLEPVLQRATAGAALEPCD